MIRLPFPERVLEQYPDLDLTLSVTLSYFVQPTASLVRRDYAGVRLHWDMQGPTESERQFQARINRLVRDSGVARGPGSYNWIHGELERSRGTLQHDAVKITASELFGSRLVAVYPVLGWWEQSREYMGRSIPFSLVASIDLGSADVDVYNPIAVELEVDIES